MLNYISVLFIFSLLCYQVHVVDSASCGKKYTDWINVAINKKCNMTSIYNEGFSNNCSAAINDNCDSVYQRDQCIHSNHGDFYPTWTVDLGQLYKIGWITVFKREGADGSRRMANVTVSVDSSIVYNFSSSPLSDSYVDILSNIQSSNLPVSGRYLSISKSGLVTSRDYYLNICEVQVWVCKPGYYFSNNDCKWCSRSCSDKFCDSIEHPGTCQDPCASSPCYNNGTCTSNVTGYSSEFTCTCFEGFLGRNCSTDIDECNISGKSLCVHGDCRNTIGSYYCSCYSGYTGDNCSTDIDECRQSACVHGQCYNTIGSYVCSCDWGYTGHNCTDDIDECSASSQNPCLHGRCQNTVGSFNCSCFAGYSGANCTADIDECNIREKSLCVYGDCRNTIGSYYCSCYSGYTGGNCSTARDSQTSVAQVVGGIVGAGFTIGALVIVVFLSIRCRKKRNGGSAQHNCARDTKDCTVKAKAASNDLYNLCGEPLNWPSTPWSNDRSSTAYGNTAHYDHLQAVTGDTGGKPNILATPGADASTTPRHFAENEYANVQTAGKSEEVRTDGPEQREGKSSKIGLDKVVGGEAKKKVSKRGDEQPDFGVEPELDEGQDLAYSHADLYACYSTVQKSASQLDSFQRHLLSRLAAADILREEFQDLPKPVPHPDDAGNGPRNKKKNRFKNMWASDTNRVLLQRPAGDPDTDYINATWIKGLGQERCYIASQGPKSNSVSDFWLMLWQENVTQIVMLTNLKEDGKEKCKNYWPPPEQTKTFGHVTVSSQREERRADFVVRTFLVYHSKLQNSTVPRTVYQYHYVAWPDHGVPASTSLVNFWRYVTARGQKSAPIVIHCSAGVGRTGTFIALDLAIGQKSRGDDVHIHAIVKELREQRSIMVQTLAQYVFLHEVVLEAYTSRNSRLTPEQIDLRFPHDIDVTQRDKTIDDEFKLLMEIRDWSRPKHTLAEMEENRDKNRDLQELPDDEHVVSLKDHVKGRNQYINAVYLSSFKVHDGLLLTQLPLPHTLVDLWRLVECCDVTTIISIGAKDDEKTVKNYCQICPLSAAQELTAPPYTLRFLSCERLNANITVYNISEENKGRKTTVKIVHYTDWSGEVPGNISDVIYLVNLVRDASENSHAPVIIQCLNGSNRSGLFCVLHDIVSRLAEDDEVDIFSSVRYLQCVRRNAVTSEEQYRYCYLLAQETVRSKNVYANT